MLARLASSCAAERYSAVEWAGAVLVLAGSSLFLLYDADSQADFEHKYLS